MHDAILQPIHDFAAAWAEGSGERMARCFSEDAHFIAYDGTRLRGGAAIGAWHQPALDSVLRGTTLETQVDEVRLLTPDLALVLGSGGPQDARRSRKSQIIGESFETYLVQKQDDEWKLISLQVTRQRPIRGQSSAALWQASNLAWAGEHLE